MVSQGGHGLMAICLSLIRTLILYKTAPAVFFPRRVTEHWYVGCGNIKSATKKKELRHPTETRYLWTKVPLFWGLIILFISGINWSKEYTAVSKETNTIQSSRIGQICWTKHSCSHVDHNRLWMPPRFISDLYLSVISLRKIIGFGTIKIKMET